MSSYALFLALATWPLSALSQRSVPLPASAPPVTRAERRTPIVEAVEKIGPAVVNISAEKLVQQRRSSLDAFLGFDVRPRGYKAESLGSGVILDPSGIVVTNDHVISGASRIWVTTSDGRELEAKLEGADADNDLAVLAVDAKNLTAVKIGTTADLMIGETVIAIGNPFGLSNTVTTGIVSAVHRTVTGESGRNYSDFLQTDAAINPGNSGGALVNILGELIGINTAIVGGANTIGFAIPIDRARRVVDELLHYGEVKTVWLGLRGTSVALGTQRSGARGQGLRVRSVYPNSPAARAGLRPGDLVVSIDGRSIEGRKDFDTALASAGIGRTLVVAFRRDGQERTARLTKRSTTER
jgi:serine protease Do